VTDVLNEWAALIEEKALRSTNGNVGAAITDEVIERVSATHGHQGRRVIHFTRRPVGGPTLTRQ
jgi:hypothetical protein